MEHPYYIITNHLLRKAVNHELDELRHDIEFISDNLNDVYKEPEHLENIDEFDKYADRCIRYQRWYERLQKYLDVLKIINVSTVSELPTLDYAHKFIRDFIPSVKKEYHWDHTIFDTD